MNLQETIIAAAAVAAAFLIYSRDGKDAPTPPEGSQQNPIVLVNGIQEVCRVRAYDEAQTRINQGLLKAGTSVFYQCSSANKTYEYECINNLANQPICNEREFTP